MARYISISLGQTSPKIIVCRALAMTVFLVWSFCPQADSQTHRIQMRRHVCNSIIQDAPAALLEGSGSYRLAPGLCDVTLVNPNRDKWMLKVERSDIMNCDVIIQVFDTYMSPVHGKAVLTAGCASPQTGVIYINSSSLTVRLRHNNATDFSFSIVATARKGSSKPDMACSGFKCESGVCVDKSLICDETDNCFDFSDESNNTSHCEAGFWPFQGENWGVLASVLGAAVVLGLMGACCRHIRGKRRSSLDDLYDLNEGPYVHKYAYRYAVIRPPKKPNQTNVVLGRDGHMHYNATTV